MYAWNALYDAKRNNCLDYLDWNFDVVYFVIDKHYIVVIFCAVRVACSTFCVRPKRQSRFMRGQGGWAADSKHKRIKWNARRIKIEPFISIKIIIAITRRCTGTCTYTQTHTYILHTAYTVQSGTFYTQLRKTWKDNKMSSASFSFITMRTQFHESFSQCMMDFERLPAFGALSLSLSHCVCMSMCGCVDVTRAHKMLCVYCVYWERDVPMPMCIDDCLDFIYHF